MKTLNAFARLLGVLALVLASSAWAITDQEVLDAVKNGDPDAAEKVAALAAEQNKSVAEVVSNLVALDPFAAPQITAAAVQANPSNADVITRAAVTAVKGSRVPSSAKTELLTNVIAAALAGAPEKAGAIRTAVVGLVPQSVIDAANQRIDNYSTPRAVNGLRGPGNNGTGTGSGSGSGSGGGGGGGKS